jgi:hypothetical protein
MRLDTPSGSGGAAVIARICQMGSAQMPCITAHYGSPFAGTAHPDASRIAVLLGEFTQSWDMCGMCAESHPSSPWDEA